MTEDTEIEIVEAETPRQRAAVMMEDAAAAYAELQRTAGQITDALHNEARDVATCIDALTQFRAAQREAWRGTQAVLRELVPTAPTPGQRAFGAYRAARGGKNHDGTPTPTWGDLTDGVRDGWEIAASAVIG